MMSGFIWKLRAAYRLWTLYAFDSDDAWELAAVLHYEQWMYHPHHAVDEEMTYWGD